MHINTPFQLLSDHIVKSIVDYVVNKSIRDNGVDYTSNERVLMPLLWVCHNFRAHVYALFCRHWELILCADEDKAAITINSWRGPVGNWAQNLAKGLTIAVDLRSIYSGNALQKLSTAPFEGCAFPLVREFSLFIYVNDQSTGDYPPETLANIAAFVQRVKEMAPSVNKISMAYTPEVEELLTRRDPHLLDLAKQLYNAMDVTSVVIAFEDLSTHYIDWEHISNLAHIYYSIYDDATAILSLARRNAQTLRTLHIKSPQMSVIPDLIQDPDSGRYVEYSRLHKLTLRTPMEPDDPDGLVFAGAVPFPSLRRLLVDCDYPFSDDVLFRGNNATLEFLDLTLYRRMVLVLEQFNVFTPTSHPRLQCVKVATFSADSDPSFATAAEYVEFGLSIAPGASVRTIPYLHRLDIGSTLLPKVLGNYPNIRVLNFPDLQLTIWEAFDLIGSLPQLLNLRTRAPKLGNPIKGDSNDELPGYVRFTYAPMGMWFRYWVFDKVWDRKLANLATCVLLLALVCPNFDYAVVDRAHHNPFMKALKATIKKPEFSPDAPRLRRLLF
ncbi:hypothetical protein GGI21_001386 [Coemansia aciculifera]|nr:hypothetical protein GGI21_001386 [Coemansia aciculifera]